MMAAHSIEQFNLFMSQLRETNATLDFYCDFQRFPRMRQLGITYLRAGDSKGSLLVKQGFERLGYVCLHTNGDNPQMYKLRSKGFQIWTAEELRGKGFTAENAPYYAVLRFDGLNSIPFDQSVNLKQKSFTNVAKIRPLSDFIAIR